MSTRNTYLRYGSVAMTFHWAIALLIVANLGVGFYFANVMDSHDPMFFGVVQIHKSIGLTVLVLSVLRLGWRLINPIPPLPSNFSTTMRILARGSHYLFYFLIIGVPLLGWSMVSASPRGTPTPYFGLFSWPNIPFLAALPRAEKRQYVELFATAHAYLAYSALGLLVVHVSAALWHQFSRKEDVLKRMLPGTNVSPVAIEVAPGSGITPG
ncbi:MAG: cytochrome b [Alphaproteobacteria bacterium]|nr:cytochrome b [Alphaproteobacteria bacterium]